ncbi:precorrin-2 C(20)-methyltransferase [Marinomonas agarivorans]|nr:precorrin-2 C(20)-methyltransferase [Marinomonas agarivorans]
MKTAISNGSATGRLIGVGVGPGDPELLTLKAFRLIKDAAVISYITNDRGLSQAKQIAREALQCAPKNQRHIEIVMPMSTDRTLANRAYDQGAQAIQAILESGNDVVFLCEGDPLFFGSFAYILARIKEKFTCQVVAGITSINAASAALMDPLTLQQETFTVVNGRQSDQLIEQALRHHDTVVIMKAGQARTRILALLKATNRYQDASYLEYIGRENERIVTDLDQLGIEAGPYFSLFIVCRHQRPFFT